MKRLICGLILCFCASLMVGQVDLQRLELRERDFSVLGERAQEQFRKDVQQISEDDRLKRMFTSQVEEATADFTGTKEEKVRVMARIARSLVAANGDPSGNNDPGDFQVSAPLNAELASRPKVINRDVRVTPDILVNREETATPDEDSLGNTYNQDPAPLNPGRSSGNVFQGHIAYHIPDTMEVGNTSRIRLVVSIDPEIARQLASRNEEDLYSDEIGIGRYLKARLDDYDSFGPDDKNFRFQLFQGDSIQVINPDDPEAAVVWEWKVRPLNTGVHAIGVVVSIIVFDERLPGEMGYRSLDTYEQPIRILATEQSQVNAAGSAKPNTGQKPGVLQVLGAIIALFVLAALAFWFSKWRRTNKLRAEATASESALNQENQIPEVRQGDGHADPEEIRALVLAGEFDKAAGELMDLAELRNYPDKASIITLQARINHWQSDVYNNLIDGESARQERSRITHAVVSILEEIEATA